MGVDEIHSKYQVSRGHRAGHGHCFLPSVVLAQIDVKDGGVHARLKVGRKGTRKLVVTLIDVPNGGAVCTEHRNDTIRVSVRASDVRPTQHDPDRP